MKKILISSTKKQYKANLHCHSTLSDGKLTPEALKEMYKSHGYDILAITDHSHPYSHTAMSDSDFLMLTGYEAYILFVIAMKGVTTFSPNDAMHRAFGEALRRAEAAGVRILAMDCRVEPDSVVIDMPVRVCLALDPEEK